MTTNAEIARQLAAVGRNTAEGTTAPAYATLAVADAIDRQTEAIDRQTDVLEYARKDADWRWTVERNG